MLYRRIIYNRIPLTRLEVWRNNKLAKGNKMSQPQCYAIYVPAKLFIAGNFGGRCRIDNDCEIVTVVNQVNPQSRFSVLSTDVFTNERDARKDFLRRFGVEIYKERFKEESRLKRTSLN